MRGVFRQEISFHPSSSSDQKLTVPVRLDGVEADGVGPREDRAGLDDRRADEGDGEDRADRPDEAVDSDADITGGGGHGLGRRRLFGIRHDERQVGRWWSMM